VITTALGLLYCTDCAERWELEGTPVESGECDRCGADKKDEEDQP
jgi:hypothetical protein